MLDSLRRECWIHLGESVGFIEERVLDSLRRECWIH